MQNANDEHALFVWDVKDHVGLVHEAPQFWGKFTGTAAIERFVSKGLKTGFKSAYVATGLLDSKSFDGVISNPGKIGLGTAAQPEQLPAESRQVRVRLKVA